MTGRCNLGCLYCFYADEMAARDDLPEERWQVFFDELGKLAVRELTLSGGEVFTRRDLWSLLDGIIRNRMRFSILSNGTLLSDAVVRELERRRHRLTNVQVSIDGATSAVHDRSRGAGSFKRALAGLQRLREARLPAGVRVTINRYNVDEIEHIADFLLGGMELRSFGCNEAMAMGAGCANRDEISLSPAEQVRAMRALERSLSRYPGRINATAGPLAKVRAYRDMERARATGERPRKWRMGTLSACGCAFNKLAVHHDGVIAPCNMLAVEIGRIGRDRIVDIWAGDPTLAELRNRKEVATRSVPECRDCEWAEYCNASCPGTAFARTGSLVSANLDDCYREFLKGIDEETRQDLFAWPQPTESGT